MSELHVRQIKAALEKLCKPHIDASDISSLPLEQFNNHVLSRSLVTYALSYVANVPAEEAAKAITDGGQDNGLDAVLYNPTDRTLYLVQGKWRHDGTGSIERAEVGKFLKGFRDLLSAQWDRFNEKIQSKSQLLDSVLDDASNRISLLIVYSGQSPLDPVVEQDIKDVVAEINNPTELVSYQVLRQSDIYAAVAQGLDGAPINIDVALLDWGQVREPYAAFYGHVAAIDVAGWYSTHQSRLFAPNIRMFLGTTDVNETIYDTLATEPSNFWYFNNGITALCRTIRKKPIGGTSRESGVFECTDMHVVNGAQTVGAIAKALAKNEVAVSEAQVFLRVIALENCPPEFEKLVTRYTNTQNRIDRRDFVALDTEQERIRGELLLEGVTYVFKSGESSPNSSNGFDLIDATVALACKRPEVALAVQAKREIGKLWDDITKAPYKTLFNPTVAGPMVWRAVQILRVIEEQLAPLRSNEKGRRRLVAVHGNRLIAHLVLNFLPQPFLTSHSLLSADERTEVGLLALALYERVVIQVNSLYPDAYIAMLFKNAAKCGDVKAAVLKIQ